MGIIYSIIQCSKKHPNEKENSLKVKENEINQYLIHATRNKIKYLEGLGLLTFHSH